MARRRKRFKDEIFYLYPLQNEAPPDSFHRLTVKLPNRPNLTARHKQGYYAR